MRLAVIDNSTLTAVQRLLGEIEVENTSSLDGDIAAFETLIQAILFYDTVLYIDDYKQDFRSSRRATFHYLGSIDTASIPYQKLIGAATALVDDVILKVKAGKINPNEIGAFLNSLKMYTTFTWDMRGSEYFLTMKMLEGAGGLSAEKYSTLNEMIFLELRANRETVAIRRSGQYYSLVGSDGRSIPKDEVSLQVRAFASSLNWLAIRTAFYTLFSCNYKADAILHPIRSAFQLSLAGRLGLPENAFAPILKRFSDETAQVLKEITIASEPVVAEMDIPLFSAWLVGKTGSPRAAIAAAFEMRNEKPLSEARRWLVDLEQATGEPSRKNFVRDGNRLVRELKEAGDILRKLYGVETKNGVPLSPLISIYNVLGSPLGLPPLPSFPLKVSLPDKMLEIKIRRGFKGVCRSVVQDLVAVARLGEYHEKLTSEVQFKDGRRSTFPTKTEDVRFLGRAAYWKKPM